MNYTLDDVVELNKKYPKEVRVPPLAARMGIKVGSHVKLSFRPKKPPKGDFDSERMWVLVLSTVTKSIKTYTGALSNDPELVDIKNGELIQFRVENICDIIPPITKDDCDG